MGRLIRVLIASLAFLAGASLGCREDSGNNGGPNRALQTREITGPNDTPAVRSTMTAADDLAAARAVIQRAIEVHGGIDRLAKWKTQVRTMKGEINKGGVTPVTCEVSVDLPEKARWAYELDKGGQKVPLTLIVNGDKGWQLMYGAVKEMSKQQVDEIGCENYILWVTGLAVLRDPGFELSVLPDIKVAEQPAAGVKVARKGRQDVKLYFDKKTGLLVKAEQKVKEAGLDFTREYFYAEPKEFDGVKLPTKQVQIDNDKKAAEWTITGFKLLDQLPASTFDKP